MTAGGSTKLRSQLWFDDPSEPGMTALYLERFLNYGLNLGRPGLYGHNGLATTQGRQHDRPGGAQFLGGGHFCLFHRPPL